MPEFFDDLGRHRPSHLLSSLLNAPRVPPGVARRKMPLQHLIVLRLLVAEMRDHRQFGQAYYIGTPDPTRVLLGSAFFDEENEK